MDLNSDELEYLYYLLKKEGRRLEKEKIQIEKEGTEEDLKINKNDIKDNENLFIKIKFKRQVAYDYEAYLREQIKK